MAGLLVIAIAGTGAVSERVAERTSTASGGHARLVGTRSETCPPNTKRVPSGCIPQSAARVVYGERCKSARRAVVHYRNLTWERQVNRGGQLSDRTPIVRGKTCRWARIAAEVWVARARSALRAYEKWFTEHYLRDFHVTAGANAWHNAVEEVQRVYPGTESWLLSCSASEGGWGRWVPNSQGSGVGGWMQMYPSTFWRMFGAARADAQARGFIVPRSAASWYSPLGQALGSAWALLNGRRGEWFGAGC